MSDDEDLKLVERALAQAEPWRSATEGRVVSVERTQFDGTYLEFLDEQIRLSPRGPEWTARLKARRTALAPWGDRPLLAVRASVSGTEFWVKIDPESGRIVLWEAYDEDEHAG